MTLVDASPSVLAFPALAFPALVLPALALVTSVAFAMLCAVSFRARAVPFWPPAETAAPSSARHSRARLFLNVYRLMIATLVAASIGVLAADPPNPWLFFPGLALTLIGFGAGALVIASMGWANALGAPGGLKRTGPFRYSRNPTYLAHWAGMAGWALALHNPIVALALASWAAGYAMMAYLEEPWLEARYGEAYRAYCKCVPRFL